MPVHVLGETRDKLDAVCGMLEHTGAVSSELLSGASVLGVGFDAVVISADLRVLENISAVKAVWGKIRGISKRVFLIDQNTRLAFVQASALGATHVLAHPINQQLLLKTLANVESPPLAPDKPASAGQEAASAGAASIASMFSAVISGSQIDVAGARNAGSQIANSIAEDGLSTWLSTVRRHHEGTYQHCLLVTGLAADFGLCLGMAKTDVERLYSAAMFHDIGKAKIPLTILDKPGRLDEQERALIETHPAAGYDVLRATAGISEEILDAVRHHHEYLDGSGYPDGLCAESIADIVRMLTICDIFAALIEERTYKPTMPREKAYEILLDMKGKLERPLVEAFREVALKR